MFNCQKMCRCIVILKHTHFLFYYLVFFFSTLFDTTEHWLCGMASNVKKEHKRYTHKHITHLYTFTIHITAYTKPKFPHQISYHVLDTNQLNDEVNMFRFYRVYESVWECMRVYVCVCVCMLCSMVFVVGNILWYKFTIHFWFYEWMVMLACLAASITIFDRQIYSIVNTMVYLFLFIYLLCQLVAFPLRKSDEQWQINQLAYIFFQKCLIC